MEELNFEVTAKRLFEIGLMSDPDKVKISIPNGKDILWRGIKHFVGEDKARWIPAYDDVSKWITNNEGKGLLLLGSCGLGKSLIATKVLPCIINHYCRKVVSVFDAQAMNANPDEVKGKHILCLDDIGTEGLSVKFGDKRLVFSEIVDEAERKGKLLLVTTNLSINEIREKYGERTIDRLKQITKPILFNGQSFRG